MVVDINSDDNLPAVSAGGERRVLQPREELRLEVPFGGSSSSADTISFVLQKGSAELYGCELALHKLYAIPQGGVKIALFTWHGAVIDLMQGSGVAAASSTDESMSYTSDETDCNVAYVNTHAQLESLRDDASEALQNENDTTTTSSGGPRVLIVGPAESGKTTLSKTLIAYACKVGRTPLWVDLDPNDNAI
ncbi:MAG: hypothetical protein SGARI_003404, partial [Bacillariaceae sp.]